MADRNERIRIFEETMKLCRNHPTLVNCVEYSTRGQKIIWQEDPLFPAENRYAEPATLVLSPQRTFEAARKYTNQGQRVCALNFASSVTPGGGVTRGTTTQEESMCRISTLYASINDKETAGAFYERHWQMIHDEEMGRENRDDCIYTPGIKVIREDTFDCDMLSESEWYSVDVITCAAPDLRYDENGRTYRPSTIELIQVFENRWKRILSVAAQHKADVLILGAFGCGAFHNPPEIVVQAFNNVYGEFKHSFDTIEFAVYRRDSVSPNYDVFRNIQGIWEVPSMLDWINGDDSTDHVPTMMDRKEPDAIRENDESSVQSSEIMNPPKTCTDNGIMVSEAAFSWHKLLSMIDLLNRRVKEPGWRYEDKQVFYQLKDRMLKRIMRNNPECLEVSLYYIPYIQYSAEAKDKAGEMMRRDRNQYSFEYYLTQVPLTESDIEISDKAMVELQANCLGETYCFHMPVQLAAECGVIPIDLPRKQWVAAPAFHHNMLEEAEPIIQSLLREVDRWKEGEQHVYL